MSAAPSEIQFIPYQQKDEPPRRAALARVEFDLTGFTDEDIQVLGHLAEAVSMMNPVYRDQYEPKTPTVLRLLERLWAVATPEQQAAIHNYRVIYNLQNSPYSLLPRKNHLLMLPESDVRALVTKAGGGRA